MLASTQGGHKQVDSKSLATSTEEAPPTLTVRDVQVLEGSSETNTVVSVQIQLSSQATSPVTATYLTADGTALEDSDYRGTSGTVTFDTGATSTVVFVDVIADSVEETDERFYLDVSSAEGAEVADGRGGISILDDDGSHEGRTPPEESGAVPAIDAQAPTITITTPEDQQAPTGWYNKSTSGTDGVTVSVIASDPSGVTSVTCKDGSKSVLNTTDSGTFAIEDGVHPITCSAIDGEGNRGAGEGSTAMPATLRVDQTAPTVACATTKPKFFLHDPAATVRADVGDVTSGPDATTAHATANTTAVGQDMPTNVTGLDVAGNSTTIACLYDVIYRFSGFQAPISASGPQDEQAGRTVPVKWRISDFYDVGVDDLASFQTLTSFSDTCGTDRQGEATESSPGRSELQSQGDGNYHFNWKTPSSYSGKCRTMSLNLLDGQSDRLASFRFR
ncbi:MAG: PxKF domain-containing protein [Actinobacteria bacterium]|nr:PxKF domain-containing protein [Actinomycetota bacterium]